MSLSPTSAIGTAFYQYPNNPIESKHSGTKSELKCQPSLEDGNRGENHAAGDISFLVKWSMSHWVSRS